MCMLHRKSELLVGAPLYAGSAMGKRHKGVFDAGHVYVFASNLTRVSVTHMISLCVRVHACAALPHAHTSSEFRPHLIRQSL